VNEFVEECRREWRRLRVPDPVADEMAADLEADLEEAEAEGVSPEEVLGSGAADPRSFAASWAAERGVSRLSRAQVRFPMRWFILSAIAALVAIAVSGAVLILASPSGPGRLVLPLPPTGSAARVVFATLPPPPTGSAVRVVFATPVETNDSGADRTVGSVLLIVGLAGIVLWTPFWLWPGLGRSSLRRA
jgi:hypothetical protein